jgi:glycosyltransferase involved in cell wall biosynthesis
MKNLSIVSVLITTFNRCNLLNRAIVSVLKQDYPIIQIIVVDDGSTDGTQNMMNLLCSEYKNIHYIKHPFNLGNAKARNTAWQNANGKYLAFLDDDDYWITENKISIQVSSFEKASVKKGICCTRVLLKNQDKHLEENPKLFPLNIRFQILQGNEVIHNSTVMVKKSLMIKVGGFDDNLPRGIDSEFFRNVITKHNYEILFLPITTTYYETEGTDRITTKKGIKEAKKIFFVHAYILKKYWKEYLNEPYALFIRIKNLILQPLRVIINR